MPRRILLAAVLVVLAAPCRPAAAADCAPPALIASLDMRVKSMAGWFSFDVPVVLNGQARRMSLSLQAHSHVSASIVPPDAEQPRVTQLDARGHYIPAATIATLQFGGAIGRNLTVLSVVDDPKPDDPVGTIGLGILGNFDMEIDFAARKINLFEHEGCAGGGVRWAAKYAALPFETGQFLKVALRMMLDGKRVVVTPMLDLAWNSMPLAVAAKLFDIQPGDPRIERLTTDRPLLFGNQTFAPEQLTLQRYTFEKLTEGDFVLEKPQMNLTGAIGDEICDGRTKRSLGMFVDEICFGQGDLSLGLVTLSQWHLYFAFKEQVLYVTPAGTPPN